jgi:hypothetical protein
MLTQAKVCDPHITSARQLRQNFASSVRRLVTSPRTMVLAGFRSCDVTAVYAAERPTYSNGKGKGETCLAGHSHFC